MNLLFCNEGPLYIDENNEYYGSALNDEFFEKYYQIADFITICIRVKKITSEEAKVKYTKLNLSKKRIVDIPNLMSFKSFMIQKKVENILKSEIDNADIIVVRVPSVAGNIAAKIARHKNKEYIADVVGCPWDSLTHHSYKGKLIAFPMFLAQRKTVKNANYSIYVTKKFLQKRYPTKNKSIALSDVLIEDNDADIISNRLKRIKEKKEKIIIGTIAAIDVKYKGQENVIKAISKLKNAGKCNFEYQLVGGGNPNYIFDVAKKYGVEENVIILGSLPHEKVFSWLDKIDIYIQPSFQEGLSRALIEAMSRGVPCIASDVGGNPELVSENWIYNRKKSVKQIVQKLSQIDNVHMEEMAKENFKLSKEYQKDYLNQKRKVFYDEIKEKISKNN